MRLRKNLKTISVDIDAVVMGVDSRCLFCDVARMKFAAPSLFEPPAGHKNCK